MSTVRIEDRLAGMKPVAASNILLIVIVAVIVTFLIWAALTELNRTVRGVGRVVPSSELQVVSNLEGGIVEEILVETGDRVRAGDPLIRLDRTETGSDFSSSRASIGALQAKVARLEAEITAREPRFPADPALAQQIEIERALYASRMADFYSLMNAAKARVEQAERAVAEAEAMLEAQRSARDAAAAEVAMLRPLVERGIEPRLSLVQAESRAAVAASEAAAASAALTRAEAGVIEARASLESQVQDWRAQAATELAQAQAELASRRRALPALAGRVERTVLRAPLDGRINRVLKSTVGGSVAPGEPLVEIVPSEETLIVEADISPADIAWVRIGQPARVDITAYDPAVYGALDGEVITISPDATLDEQTGETFYEVQVRTEEDALVTSNGRRLPIGPGMVAEVSLLGEERSILDYILTPITRLQQRAFRE